MLWFQLVQDVVFSIVIRKGCYDMEKIYEILENIRPEFDFRHSADFIEDGFLDSFDVVSLVSELESKYDCLIDALDILPENFNNIDNIIAVVKKNGGRI